jgi:hypothetical protein
MTPPRRMMIAPARPYGPTNIELAESAGIEPERRMTPLEQLSSACDDHATAQSAGSKSTGLWPPARTFSRPLSGCERRSRLPFSDALGVVAPHRIVIAWRPDTSGLLGLPKQAQSSVEHGQQSSGRSDCDHDRDECGHGQRQDEHGEADDEHERDSTRNTSTPQG